MGKKLLLMLIGLLLPMSVIAYDCCINGIYYNLDISGGQAEVTCLHSKGLEVTNRPYTGDIVIPKAISYGKKMYTVTAIGDEAFNYCTRLTSVELPNTILSIGQYAFDDCWKLEAINIPNSLKTIKSFAFRNCSSLLSIKLTENVTDIRDFAFNKSGIVSIVLPEGLERIAHHLFEDCYNLEEVSIPKSVKYIGISSLSGTKITTLSIPENVTSIYEHAFSGCRSLKSIVLSPNIETIGNEIFAACESLKHIYCPIFEPPSVDGNFYHTWYRPQDCIVHVPSTSIDKYNIAPWSAQFTIVPLIEGDPGYEGIVSDDEDGTPEPYAVLSDDNKTLTFYYDGKKKSRKGMGVGPFIRDVDFNTWTFIINSEWYNQRESILTVEFDAPFANYTGLTSTAFWFYGCSNLKTINGLENLNTSNVETMEDMFYYCSSLTSLDVSNFNTANVTSMNSMFSGCSSLTSLDVSHFNTANVIDMYNMFGGCSSLLSLDVSHFNTVNVTSMANMFYGCSVLTSLNVSNFNTANVTEMSGMFCDCSSLTSIDLSLFNTTNVKRMGSMFYGCLSIANLDLHSFDSSNVTDMSHMFKECSSLKSLDVSSFNTSNVTDMSYMFYYCSSLTKLDVSKFNTSNVKNMTGMFDHCSSLTNLDVSGFKTDKVTGMLYMFRQCSSLISLDVSKFNTSNVTNMFAMFDGCSSLRSLDVSNFNTSNVTDMWEMFRYCSSLTNLDVSNFNTSNVTSMSEMFYECRGLTNLDVSNFDTSNVTDMFDMFSSCSSLTSLDLSRFDTRKVTTMEGMFYWCSALTTIYCNEIWQCNGYNMFYGCTSLKGAISYDSNKTDVTYANPTTGYFTKKGDKTDDLKDGDTFTANTVEGVDMTFKVISASDKTCQVGTGVALGVSIDKEYSGSISIPETVNGFRVTTVAFEAFGSSKINSVVIGNNVTYINQNAFSNCQRLKSVTFPNNNGFSLGLWPFQGCTSLETITLPKNLTSMDCNPFMGCSSLSYIGVDENNPNYMSVDGVVYSKDTKAIYAYPCGRQSTNYEIIGGTQVLGRGAFMSASKLEKIHIPNSVSQIYAQAFWECTNLNALILPPDITYIPQNMATFSGIKEVVIPNKVTSIESSAFSVCFNLISVKVEIEEPLAIDENTFGNRANATLYVPMGSVDAYSKADYWKNFKKIMPIGDANGDGAISDADVKEAADFIMDRPSETFVEAAADMNGDGVVNIIDIVLMNAIKAK